MVTGLLDVQPTSDRWLLAEGALFLVTGFLFVLVYGARIMAYWSGTATGAELSWIGPLPWFVMGLGALMAGAGLVLGISLGRHLFRIMAVFLGAYVLFVAAGWEPYTLGAGLATVATLLTLVGVGLLQFTERGREHLKHAGAWPAPGA